MNHAQEIKYKRIIYEQQEVITTMEARIIELEKKLKKLEPKGGKKV